MKRNLEKMTLNKIWSECIRMWKWIATVWGTSKYANIEVEELKDAWLKRNGYINKNRPFDTCFFCYWQDEHGDGERDINRKSCNGCPGELVSKRFHCCNRGYDYYAQPRVFYKKLLELDKKRRK